jgi:hypothetical protein
MPRTQLPAQLPAHPLRTCRSNLRSFIPTIFVELQYLGKKVRFLERHLDDTLGVMQRPQFTHSGTECPPQVYLTIPRRELITVVSVHLLFKLESVKSPMFSAGPIYPLCDDRHNFFHRFGRSMTTAASPEERVPRSDVPGRSHLSLKEITRFLTLDQSTHPPTRSRVTR